MANETENKRVNGSEKSRESEKGGDSIRKAQEWGGGSKASKGPVTQQDKRNENSSAKS